MVTIISSVENGKEGHAVSCIKVPKAFLVSSGSSSTEDFKDVLQISSFQQDKALEPLSERLLEESIEKSKKIIEEEKEDDIFLGETIPQTSPSAAYETLEREQFKERGGNDPIDTEFSFTSAVEERAEEVPFRARNALLVSPLESHSQNFTIHVLKEERQGSADLSFISEADFSFISEADLSFISDKNIPLFSEDFSFENQKEAFSLSKDPLKNTSAAQSPSFMVGSIKEKNIDIQYNTSVFSEEEIIKGFSDLKFSALEKVQQEEEMTFSPPKDPVFPSVHLRSFTSSVSWSEIPEKNPKELDIQKLGEIVDPLEEASEEFFSNLHKDEGPYSGVSQDFRGTSTPRSDLTAENSHANLPTGLENALAKGVQERSGFFESAVNTPSPLAQTQIYLHQAFKTGKKEISFDLHPIELGQLQVKLKFDADKNIQAFIQAQTQEAYELLQKDFVTQKVILDSFAQAGWKSDENSLQFSYQEAPSHHEEAKDLYSSLSPPTRIEQLEGKEEQNILQNIDFLSINPHRMYDVLV